MPKAIACATGFASVGKNKKHKKMSLKILMIILLLGNYNLNGQDERKKDNPIEINLKVWQETEKDYKRFIKKQARIRKKLDKYIEPQDLDKLKILRAAYQNEIKETERRGELIPKIRQDGNTAMFVESWNRMNDRFKYQIRSHEIINPMLSGNKGLYEVAEYLAKKYDKQIKPIKKRINKAYQKLKKKERKVYLKYYEEKTKNRKNHPSNSKNTAKKPSQEVTVFSNTKILIIESKKKNKSW